MLLDKEFLEVVAENGELRVRIAELESIIAVHRLAVDVDALKARIEELTAALKPFADKATVYPDLPDNWVAHVTMKHLRAARAAYYGEQDV